MSGHSIILGIIIGLGIGLERLQKNNNNRNTRGTNDYRSGEQTQNDNRKFGHKEDSSFERRYEEEIDRKNLQEPIGYNVMDFGLEFEKRMISERRCKEIDSLNIQNPLRSGMKDFFTAQRHYFVTNRDESILFCHAFSPRYDDRDGPDYERPVFLLCINKEYRFIRYTHKSVADDRSGSVPICNEDVIILEEEFIEKSEEKEKLLDLLKCLISKYEKEHSALDEIRAMGYHFKFYYKDEKIGQDVYVPGKIFAIENLITEFEYRGISKKRCYEIDSLKLQDPYGYGEILMAENERFVTNKDESILFCCAFMPNHDDIDLGVTQRTYLLVVNKSHYMIHFKVDAAKAVAPKHWFFKVDISEKDYIDENRDELLSILKRVIAVYIKKHRREMPEEHFEYLFYYKGEEI